MPGFFSTQALGGGPTPLPVVGTWQHLGYADPSVWKVAGIGDFNDDGTDDVLWSNKISGAVGTWIIQNGVPTSWRSLGTASGPWTMVGVGDITGDGTADVLWQNQSTGAVGAWLVSSNGGACGWASSWVRHRSINGS